MPVLAKVQLKSSAAAQLESRLASMDGVVADFEQEVTDARGLVIEQSSGKLYLAKPNFRWEVAAPYPQIIVAQDQELQIYDPDLEQVTLRSLGSVSLSPLALLTQSKLNLADQFDISQLNLSTAEMLPGKIDADGELQSSNEQLAAPGNVDLGAGDSQRFTLIPKAQDALFAQVEILFRGGNLRALIFADHTGQRSAVTFSDLQTEQVIGNAIFELNLPPDVDIVRG